MAADRVPRSLFLFNAYIINTDNRQLATNPTTSNPFWTDFGWTLAESNAWTADRTNFATNIYPPVADPTLAPPGALQTAHNFRNTFADNKASLLDKIVASGKATPMDALIFHVDLEHHDPTFHTTPIADSCFAKVQIAGLGAFDIHCNVLENFGHSHIPVAHGANSIQYAYQIFDNRQQATGPFNPNDASFVKGTSSRAHFPLNVGEANQGKWIVIYFRWFNTKHANIVPGWTNVMYSTVIG